MRIYHYVPLAILTILMAAILLMAFMQQGSISGTGPVISAYMFIMFAELVRLLRIHSKRR